MPRADAHKWEFKSRFRRHAFGWRSQPAILRVRQAARDHVESDPTFALGAGLAALRWLSCLRITREPSARRSIGSRSRRLPTVEGAARDA